MRSFKIYGNWPQALALHTHNFRKCSHASAVWGSLRLAPMKVNDEVQMDWGNGSFINVLLCCCMLSGGLSCTAVPIFQALEKALASG